MQPSIYIMRSQLFSGIRTKSRALHSIHSSIFRFYILSIGNIYNIRILELKMLYFSRICSVRRHSHVTEPVLKTLSTIDYYDKLELSVNAGRTKMKDLILWQKFVF